MVNNRTLLSSKELICMVCNRRLLAFRHVGEIEINDDDCAAIWKERRCRADTDNGVPTAERCGGHSRHRDQ